MLGPLPATGAAAAAPQSSATPSRPHVKLWGDDGFTFGDLVDVINPLQHIPFVSWAYRAITGDKISPVAKVLGDGVYGGVLGLALGAADAALQAVTGRDTADTVLAMLGGGHNAPTPVPPPPSPVLIAEAAESRRQATPTAADLPEFSEDQFALLVGAFGPPAPVSTVPAARPNPAWVEAATKLPDDQVALLLQSVGLTPGQDPAKRVPTVAVKPVGSFQTAARAPMPAAPVQPIVVTTLAPPQAAAAEPAAADRDAEHAAMRAEQLRAARETGDELRRLFGRP